MNHHGENIPLLLIFLPVVYMLLWRKLEVMGKKKKTAIFGLVILIAALIPLPGILSGFPMSFHMLKHILLLLLFPPLLLSLFPEQLFRQIFSGSGLIRSVLKQPIFCYLIGMTVMVLVNLPMLSGIMMHEHPHVLLNISGLSITLPADWGMGILLQITAGMIYSIPVFAPVPELRIPGLQKILYLFLSCIGCSLIGLFITMKSLLTSPAGYSDLQTAGLIMWVPGCLVYIGKSLTVLYHFFQEENLPGELPIIENSEL
jgi:cytochrome c oxidase assembly factor CtaG